MARIRIRAIPRRQLLPTLLVAWCALALPPTVKAQAPRDSSTGKPADFRSKHVLLHTDLPAKEARPLLNRFETILALISAYWGRPLAGEIECYVVRDLDAWPADAMSTQGRAKIAQRSGITTTETLSQAGRFIAGKSTVYATAESGTSEHELVHAYCGQTFGCTGPLWYSEGMAELGQFWQQGDGAVQVKQHMLDYLRTRPASVRDVIADDAADGEVRGPARTGDSWEAYARRWALCHLLVHNDNYSARFRALGLSYLGGARPRFEDVFGGQLDELEFEYQQLLAHLANGYRADLCRWDWQRKFQDATRVSTTARVQANRGWQPSGATVQSGRTYRYSAGGTWRTESDATPVSGLGDSQGRGRLEAVVFHDFELGEPFALGSSGTFTAPESGQLYLRCRDAWTSLSDNSGSLNVKIGASSAAAARREQPAPADTR